jgi:FcoT-like thioesterase domain
MAFDSSLIELVLAPYKPHCRYLVKAAAGYEPGGTPAISAQGEFCIPESCYIADTGHFNAVEFNICYNQMAYCSMAHAIQNQWLDSFHGWTLDEFCQRQLSDCMIIKLSSSFRRPMNARRLVGRFALDKVSLKKGFLFVKTSCDFSDSSGVGAEGAVLFAVNMEHQSEQP